MYVNNIVRMDPTKNHIWTNDIVLIFIITAFETKSEFICITWQLKFYLSNYLLPFPLTLTYIFFSHIVT